MGPEKFCEANPEGGHQPEFLGALDGDGAATRLPAGGLLPSPFGKPVEDEGDRRWRSEATLPTAPVAMRAVGRPSGAVCGPNRGAPPGRNPCLAGRLAALGGFRVGRAGGGEAVCGPSRAVAGVEELVYPSRGLVRSGEARATWRKRRAAGIARARLGASAPEPHRRPSKGRAKPARKRPSRPPRQGPPIRCPRRVVAPRGPRRRVTTRYAVATGERAPGGGGWVALKQSGARGRPPVHAGEDPEQQLGDRRGPPKAGRDQRGRGPERDEGSARPAKTTT